MLTPHQIASYRENGYLVVEDVLTAEQLNALRAVTRKFIERSRNVTQSNDVYDLDAGHSSEQPRLTRIKLPHTLDPIYWETITSPRMTSLLQALLGPNVRLHTSKLNTKASGGGAAVEWHQDWAFYPHTNDDLLAVGVMLDDMTEDNGPLMVIPGSHRGPILSHFSRGVFCGAIDPGDPQFDQTRAVTLLGSAGSASVHHVRTLHGSAPNSSAGSRMLLFYECIAADAWPINGNSSPYTGLSQQEFWNCIHERLICGRQPMEARLSNVPVTMPLPPPPDSTSIFQLQRSGRVSSAFASADR